MSPSQPDSVANMPRVSVLEGCKLLCDFIERECVQLFASIMEQLLNFLPGRSSADTATLVAQIIETRLNLVDRLCDLRHLYTPRTFITSSPRWLMTLTAMRPDFGRGKGRDSVRLRLSQASSSMSPFSVVLSAL